MTDGVPAEATASDVEHLLDVGCRQFDLDVGVFLEEGDDGERIAFASGDVDGAAAGLADALARASLPPPDDAVTAIDHTSQAGGPVAALHRETGFQAILACAVRSADRHLGTLCFAGRRPRDRRFAEQDEQILRVMARWLALRLEADEATRFREEVKRRLAKSEERYRTLYEKTPAMLHSIDAQGRLTSVSDIWLATMGYTREEVIGRRSTDFLTPESKRYAEEVVLPAYRTTGHCDDIPYQFVTKAGNVRDIRLSAISQTDADGNFVESLAVLFDVTERQRIERSLARKTAALERSNADLTRFARVASHDLQEPLRRIVTYCDLLQQDHGAELSEGAAAIAGVIRSGGRHLRLVINDLLAYVRVGEQLEHDAEQVDLAAVVRRALNDLNDDILAKNLRVEVAPLPLVWGRAPLMRTLFHQLLSNAIHHGGPAMSTIDVSIEDAGAFWRFAIADDGIGVEPRFGDRIFEIFQRLHPRDDRDGSGVGLAICRLIVQRCGGDIWLDHSCRNGARFQFTLPKDKCSHATSDVMVAPTPSDALDRASEPA